MSINMWDFYGVVGVNVSLTVHISESLLAFAFLPFRTMADGAGKGRFGSGSSFLRGHHAQSNPAR